MKLKHSICISFTVNVSDLLVGWELMIWFNIHEQETIIHVQDWLHYVLFPRETKFLVTTLNNNIIISEGFPSVQTIW